MISFLSYFHKYIARFFSLTGEAFLTAAIIFFLLEFALRLFPALIPLTLLTNFQKDIRGAIAVRLHLPAEEQARILERDDDGPPLKIFKPFQRVSLGFDDGDRRLGVHSPSEMDENGFCNRKENYRQHIDVIVLGDSYAWCLGVKPDELWTDQFALLSGYSVYSLGMFGTGLYEYIQLLKKFGLSRSPKVVTMNVFGGNDLQSAINFYEYREQFRASGKKEFLARPCVGLPWALCVVYRFAKESIGKHSYAFNLVANLTRDTFIRARETATPQPKRNFGYRVAVNGKEYVFNPSHTSDWDSADRVRSGEVDFHLFDEALENFMALSKEFHFMPVVTFSPPPYVAYEKYATFDDQGVRELAVWFDVEQRRYFKEKAGTLGYLFFDFTPALQRSAAEEDALLYFPSNLHLTREGHKVLASALYSFIVNRPDTQFVSKP